MEPLTIAGGVVGLLNTSIKVATALNDLYRNITSVNLRIDGLHKTVQGFISVLSMMKDTLERAEIKVSLGTTGHVNNHWTHISATIKDGQKTLLRLQKLLEKVNKSTSILDETRKNIRLQNEAQKIMVYQSLIQQYNDTLHLSLQTITVWNQSTLQQSTDKIIPKLDGLEQKVRQLAFTFSRSMTDLQAIIESKGSESQQRNEAIDRLQTFQKLENCVKSAATMVSDVATNLNNDQGHNASEFGDIFPSERSETMRRYMTANKIREEDGDPGPSNYPRRTSTGVILGVVSENVESDESDSETELEVEKFQAVMEKGKQMLDQEEYTGAEDRFLSCLKSLERVRSEGATFSWNRMSVSKPEIIRLLLEVYLSEERLEDAQSLLMEAIGSDAKLAREMTSLVEAFYQCEEYTKALACGNRALRAYRKLSQVGSPEEQRTLQLLVDVCKAQGNQDGQITFEDLLAQRQNNPPHPSTRPRNKSITLHSASGESSGSGPIGESMARHGRRKSSDLFSSSEDLGPIGEPSVSPQTLSLLSVPSTKTPFDDQASPWSLGSLPTPELTYTDSDGGKSRTTPEFHTPRSSIATTLESKSPNIRPEGGYFDPVSQSYIYPRRSRVESFSLPKSALSATMYTGNFEQEVDEIFNVSAQQHHTSFSTTNFSFGPKLGEAKDERETHDDILPAPSRHGIKKGFESEKGGFSSRIEKEDEIGDSSHLMTSSKVPSPSLQIRTGTNLNLGSAVLETKRLYKKVVVVGDSKCGKTPLLTLMMRGNFPEHTQPTEWHVEKMDIEVQGMRIDLVVWEIGGHDKQGLSRLLSSPKPDAFLICFSIDSPRSLAMVQNQWHKDVKKFGKKVPYILVGLKGDLRSDPSTIEDLRRRGERPSIVEEGQAMADLIEATQYLECSAKTGEGIHEVLDAVTHLTISNDLAKEMKRRDKADERNRKEGDEDKKSPGTKRFRDFLRRSTS